MSNKEIGGYFSLELQKKGSHYHKKPLKLNSARNCFEYILKAIKVSKIYMPHYNCSVMLEPVHKTNTSYEFYAINEGLEIKSKIALNQDEYILYINYFGIKNKYIERLINSYGDKLIIDNSQSFFSEFTTDIFSIYSPRKFFGVSDGGYLIGGSLGALNLDMGCDLSNDRIEHLVGRLEESGNKYYSKYKKNDDSLSMQDIKKMSKFTDLILSNINYNKVLKIRNKNFLFLNEELGSINKLGIDISSINGPMVYPLIYKKCLKKILIKNNIYVATYWPELLKIDDVPLNERYLTDNIIPLPIDQRYGIEDMKKIVNIIKAHL